MNTWTYIWQEMKKETSDVWVAKNYTFAFKQKIGGFEKITAGDEYIPQLRANAAYGS